jgi:hypothetical protein
LAGNGCRFQFDEPISKTKLQMGIDQCPASSVPYASVSCAGPWCANLMRPCIKTTSGLSDCGTEGLVCDELLPGVFKTSGTDQLLDWFTSLK